MKAKVAYSSNADIKCAVGEIKQSLGSEISKFILYFASSSYNNNDLAAEMNLSFKEKGLMGCTTAGEIISGKMLKNSIVAMAFGEELVEDFEIISIQEINDLEKSLNKAEIKFGKKVNELEADKYFGIILVDGLSGMEENLMDKLGNLTDIIFVGGSAGDDLKFSATHLFAGENVQQGGAILAIVKSKAKFGFIKTQSFRVLDKKLLPTKVDEKNREVIEFNNQPAAKYYASLLNIKMEDASNHFMNHPVGLVIDDDPYVRSPQRLNGDSMKFYCNIKEGIELNLLESTDIVKDTRTAIENYINENGSISALVNFNCILRTLELESKGQCEDYGKLFSSIPSIGFSTYGEEYIGHINQTSTILVFS